MTSVQTASVNDLLGALDLQRLDETRWQGGSIQSGGPVVFGGQLAGQAVVAAAATEPGKRVKSVHTIFARSARAEEPLVLDVAPLQSGRSFASLMVGISQGDRTVSQALILLDAVDPDVIRHASEIPIAAGPAAGITQLSQLDGWEQRSSEPVDLLDPSVVGPPELQLWSRFATDREEPSTALALLAWATVGSFIGTAMRPHEGVGLAMAHRELSTAVLSHTLVVHDAFQATDWLLLALRSTFAGAGRAFGTGEVFTQDGRLVASCAQESMIRAMNMLNGAL
jgi:acyl-CoA thioesterase II